MKRTSKWMKHLTIKELKHMKENQDSLSLRSFKVNREHQKKFDAENRGMRACLACNHIAYKLMDAGVLPPDA